MIKWRNKLKRFYGLTLNEVGIHTKGIPFNKKGLQMLNDNLEAWENNNPFTQISGEQLWNDYKSMNDQRKLSPHANALIKIYTHGSLTPEELEGFRRPRRINKMNPRDALQRLLKEYLREIARRLKLQAKLPHGEQGPTTSTLFPRRTLSEIGSFKYMHKWLKQMPKAARFTFRMKKPKKKNKIPDENACDVVRLRDCRNVWRTAARKCFLERGKYLKKITKLEKKLKFRMKKGKVKPLRKGALDIIRKNFDLEYMKQMIKNVAPGYIEMIVNYKDKSGNTPLIDAASKGDIEFVKSLLKKGANVNHKDHNNRTALYNAVRYGYQNIVKLLLDAGANVNPLKLAEPLKHSPLMIAAVNRHKNPKKFDKIIKILLKHGADINARDQEGVPAYRYLQFSRNVIRNTPNRVNRQSIQRKSV